MSMLDTAEHPRDMFGGAKRAGPWGEPTPRKI